MTWVTHPNQNPKNKKISKTLCSKVLVYDFWGPNFFKHLNFLGLFTKSYSRLSDMPTTLQRTFKLCPRVLSQKMQRVKFENLKKCLQNIK